MDLARYESHRLLRDIPRPALEELIRLCETVPLAAGEVLLTPGQSNHTLYFLLSGQLRVHLDSRDSGNSLPVQEGEIIGDMSIIEHRPVSAWGIADPPSIL